MTDLRLGTAERSAEAVVPRPDPKWDSKLILMAAGLLVLLAGAALFFVNVFRFHDQNYPSSSVWWGLLIIALGVAMIAVSSYLMLRRNQPE